MPEQLTGPEADGLDEKAHMQRECNSEEDVEERWRGVVVPVLGPGTVWQGPRMVGVLFHTLNVKGCNRVRVPRPPCSIRINVINLKSSCQLSPRDHERKKSSELKSNSMLSAFF